MLSFPPIFELLLSPNLSQSSYNIKYQKKRVVVGVGLSSANSQSIIEDSEYNEYDIQCSAIKQINEEL